MSNDQISSRQWVALAFVGLLSPLVRRFPHTLAQTVGRGGWLAVPLAVLPLLIWLPGWRCLLRKRRDWFAVLTEVLGPAAGRCAALFYALWMTAYAGFLLRAGAVRQISTVYPEAGPGVFVSAMAAVCAIAAAGSLRALARSAMILRPLLVAVILLVLALSAEHVELSLLLPVTGNDLPAAAWSGLRLANSMGAAFLLAFLAARADALPSRRQLLGWGGALLALVGAATVCCLGMFGPALTAHMRYPFFMLARDVTVLGSVERVEPLLVSVSVLSDFALISALLWTAARLVLRLLGKNTEGRARLPALLCAAGAAAAALLLPGDLDAWELLSETMVPILSAVFTAGIPMVTLAVGAVRKLLGD